MAKVHAVLELSRLFQARTLQCRDGDLPPHADVRRYIDVHSGAWNGGVNTDRKTANQRVRHAGRLERAYRVDQSGQLVRLRLHSHLSPAIGCDQPPLACAQRRDLRDRFLRSFHRCKRSKIRVE